MIGYRPNEGHEVEIARWYGIVNQLEPAARLLALNHAPAGPGLKECHGCDFTCSEATYNQDGSEERAEWPCGTAELVYLTVEDPGYVPVILQRTQASEPWFVKAFRWIEAL